MLTAMRDGTHSKLIKYVLFGFLILAMLGMVLMDVGGFFRSGGVGSTVVAKAGKDKIGMMEFDNIVRRTLSRQGISPRDAYQFGLTDQILKTQVASSMLARAAYDMGFYVGDAEVAKQINAMIEPLLKQQPGASRKDMLQRFLQAQGIGEQEFISTLRRGIMQSLLQSTVQTAAFAPSPQEAAALYTYNNESREIEGVILSDSSVKDVEKAPDDILLALYDAAKGLRYSIPETRTFTIATMGEAAVRDSIAISDEDLKKEYDANIASYTSPERRAVQQAVMKDEESARKVLEAVQGGKSLKEASGKDFQGEETYERNGLAEDIAAAVFEAAPGAAIGPFKSPLGWSVMVAAKTLPSEVKPFEKVKGDIRKDLLQMRLADQMFNTANAIDDRLAGGEALEDIAKDMNLKLEKIGPVRQDGSTPDKHDAMKDFAKDSAYILKSAFEINEGESAPVMELKDGRYATVRVDAITPASFRPFEDVKEELRKQWETDQKAAANRTRAQKLQQDLAAGTKTLSAAAGEFGLSVQTLSVKRSGEPPKGLSAETIPALFSAIEGETVMAPVPGGVLIARIKTVTLPDPAKAPEKEMKEISDTLAKNAKEELMGVYMQALERKSAVKINRHLLDSMYGPESGNPG